MADLPVLSSQPSNHQQESQSLSAINTPAQAREALQKLAQDKLRFTVSEIEVKTSKELIQDLERVGVHVPERMNPIKVQERALAVLKQQQQQPSKSSPAPYSTNPPMMTRGFVSPPREEYRNKHNAEHDHHHYHSRRHDDKPKHADEDYRKERKDKDDGRRGDDNYHQHHDWRSHYHHQERPTPTPQYAEVELVPDPWKRIEEIELDLGEAMDQLEFTQKCCNQMKEDPDWSNTDIRMFSSGLADLQQQIVELRQRQYSEARAALEHFQRLVHKIENLRRENALTTQNLHYFNDKHQILLNHIDKLRDFFRENGDMSSSARNFSHRPITAMHSSSKRSGGRDH
jgi:archaellum component FlaC